MKRIFLQLAANSIVRQSIISIYSKTLESYGRLAATVLEEEENEGKFALTYPQLSIVLQEIKKHYDLLEKEISSKQITLEDLIEELFPGLQAEVESFERVCHFVKSRFDREERMKNE